MQPRLEARRLKKYRFAVWKPSTGVSSICSLRNPTSSNHKVCIGSDKQITTPPTTAERICVLPKHVYFSTQSIRPISYSPEFLKQSSAKDKGTPSGLVTTPKYFEVTYKPDQSGRAGSYGGLDRYIWC